MGLEADIAAAEAATRKGPRCSVSIVLDSLSADDAAGLRRSLEVHKAKPIAAVLKAHQVLVDGKAIQPETIRRHQRRDCSCQ